MSVERIREIIRKLDKTPVNEDIRFNQTDLDTMDNMPSRERGNIHQAMGRMDMHSNDVDDLHSKAFQTTANHDLGDDNLGKNGVMIDGDDTFKKFGTITNMKNVVNFFMAFNLASKRLKVQLTDVKINPKAFSIYTYLIHENGTKFKTNQNETVWVLKSTGSGTAVVDRIELDYLGAASPNELIVLYHMLTTDKRTQIATRSIDKNANIVYFKS